LKRVPMTERMIMAKTEMTMHDHACITPTMGFMMGVDGSDS